MKQNQKRILQFAVFFLLSVTKLEPVVAGTPEPVVAGTPKPVVAGTPGDVIPGDSVPELEISVSHVGPMYDDGHMQV